MIETKVQIEARYLLKIASADCVKNNKRHRNIFRLDAKCQHAVNIWRDITAKEKNQNAKWIKKSGMGDMFQKTLKQSYYGISVQMTKNHNIQSARCDASKEANERYLDMRYEMPAIEQYRKEETGKENQLLATCIRDKREKIWIQS